MRPKSKFDFGATLLNPAWPNFDLTENRQIELRYHRKSPHRTSISPKIARSNFGLGYLTWILALSKTHHATAGNIKRKQHQPQAPSNVPEYYQCNKPNKNRNESSI